MTEDEMLDVGGYVGNSAASERAYAKEHGKYIHWLEAIEERG